MIPKIVFQSFVKGVQKYIVKEFEKNTEGFLWKNSTPNTKHETFLRGYKRRGLKIVDTQNKIIALQCSQMKKLI